MIDPNDENNIDEEFDEDDPERPSDPIVIIDDSNYWNMPNLLGEMVARLEEEVPGIINRDRSKDKDLEI